MYTLLDARDLTRFGKRNNISYNLKRINNNNAVKSYCRAHVLSVCLFYNTRNFHLNIHVASFMLIRTNDLTRYSRKMDKRFIVYTIVVHFDNHQ